MQMEEAHLTLRPAVMPLQETRYNNKFNAASLVYSLNW